MMHILDIPSQQIRNITPQGIHFIHTTTDEDYLPFALCYQSILLFMGSDAMPRMLAHISDNDHYQSLLSRFMNVRVIGIHDDLNRPDVHSLSLMSRIGETMRIIRFNFDSYHDYHESQQSITAHGWHIFNTTDLL